MKPIFIDGEPAALIALRMWRKGLAWIGPKAKPESKTPHAVYMRNWRRQKALRREELKRNSMIK